MKEYPGHPGVAAVILDRNVFTDDMKAQNTEYLRVKILSEAGKKYADIQIPYVKDFNHISDIRARTVHADGTVVNFDGKVFDKVVVRSRGWKVLTKAFGLPDVQVGSVIEYTYTQRWDPRWVLSDHWLLQRELYTRHAHFTLRPYRGFTIAYAWFGLPTSQTLNPQKDGTVELELNDIPALEAEDYTLPDEELEMRLDYFYPGVAVKSVEEYWKNRGKAWNEYYESILKPSKVIDRTVAELVSPGDSQDVKLRKIYARVQQVRNLTYEHAKSEKEWDKEHLKENKSIEDVLQHGYSDRDNINLLFVAMARAAGLQCSIVRVSERDDHLFHDIVLNDRQFDGTLVLVRNGAQQIYLDPGAYHCPYGLVPWEKTATTVMIPGEDGGSIATTTSPPSSEAIRERKATMALAANGTLQGTVQILYRGQEARYRRVQAREQDDVARRKDLEDDVKAWLPGGGTVKLEKVTGWEGTEEPLVADLTIEIPGFASRAGRRLILPLGLFQGGGAVFEHANRVHPIYFSYPYQDVDDITVNLPSDLQVESLPGAQETDLGDCCRYEVKREKQGNAIHLHRQFAMNVFYVNTDQYQAIREFFRQVRADDDEQAVLRPVESHASP
ncbi:MAG: DUF3857 domain-containing protein [Acidobacteriia bacterium]|nr:DUF3857 domain-containing protein [Terriglobia bacterium]